MKEFDKDIFVAEIKYDYIVNIINQANKCRGIERIVLFGSSLGEDCKEESDIDIAVFGTKSKNAYLKSKEFKDFHRNVFKFHSRGFQQTENIEIVLS